MGYIGMCSSKGYGFSAVLVVNRADFSRMILAILVINRVWFLCYIHDKGMFLTRSHFFTIFGKKINKNPC